MDREDTQDVKKKISKTGIKLDKEVGPRNFKAHF